MQQTRDIARGKRCSFLSSSAGACALEALTFGCAALDDKGVDTVYPVNALAFHPSYGTFATGGCDGK
eukprot:3800060-Rhodomonas_salina.1